MHPLLHRLRRTFDVYGSAESEATTIAAVLTILASAEEALQPTAMAERTAGGGIPCQAVYASSSVGLGSGCVQENLTMRS